MAVEAIEVVDDVHTMLKLTRLLPNTMQMTNGNLDNLTAESLASDLYCYSSTSQVLSKEIGCFWPIMMQCHSNSSIISNFCGCGGGGRSVANVGIAWMAWTVRCQDRCSPGSEGMPANSIQWNHCGITSSSYTIVVATMPAAMRMTQSISTNTRRLLRSHVARMIVLSVDGPSFSRGSAWRSTPWRRPSWRSPAWSTLWRRSSESIAGSSRT